MALLALIGTILMTVLLVWIFVSSVIYVLRDVEAPVALRLIPPCVWLLQSGGVLFRVPPSAAVVVALDAGRVTEFVPEAEHPVEIP
jgi:hypothetical protein